MNTIPLEQMSFEDSLKSLEAIVRALENGKLTLQESLDQFAEATSHLKNCYATLQNAERKIELLTGISQDGTAETVEIDDTPQKATAPARKRKL